MFDPGDPEMDPGSQLWTSEGSCWAGTFGGQKWGLAKRRLLWNKWFRVGFHGDLCEGNGLYGVKEAFRQANFPQNPARKICYRDFPIAWNKIPRPPWSLWESLLAPCGAMAYLATLGARSGPLLCLLALLPAR